jgi:hypothetical protein
VETADDAAAASSDDDRDDDDDDDDDDSPYRLAAAAAAVFDVERAPAGITWHGPDAFTVHAGGWGDDDGEGDDAGAAAASRQTVTTSFDAAVPSSSSSTASMDAFEAAADAAAVDVARHVRAAADAAGGGPLPLTEEELADYVRAALTNAMDGEVAVAGAIESDDDDLLYLDEISRRFCRSPERIKWESEERIRNELDPLAAMQLAAQAQPEPLA